MDRIPDHTSSALYLPPISEILTNISVHLAETLVSALQRLLSMGRGCNAQHRIVVTSTFDMMLDPGRTAFERNRPPCSTDASREQRLVAAAGAAAPAPVALDPAMYGLPPGTQVPPQLQQAIMQQQAMMQAQIGGRCTPFVVIAMLLKIGERGKVFTPTFIGG